MKAKMRSFSFDYESMMYVIFSSDSIYSVSNFLFIYFKELLLRLLKFPHWALSRHSIVALEALDKLSADPQNLVLYIISGRNSAFLEQYLEHQKTVGFSAELERGATVVGLELEITEIE